MTSFFASLKPNNRRNAPVCADAENEASASDLRTTVDRDHVFADRRRGQDRRRDRIGDPRQILQERRRGDRRKSNSPERFTAWWLQADYLDAELEPEAVPAHLLQSLGLGQRAAGCLNA